MTSAILLVVNVNSSVLWRATPCTLVIRKLKKNIQ